LNTSELGLILRSSAGSNSNFFGLLPTVFGGWHKTKMANKPLNFGSLPWLINVARNRIYTFRPADFSGEQTKGLNQKTAGAMNLQYY
jgi:hypothetical protein